MPFSLLEERRERAVTRSPCLSSRKPLSKAGKDLKAREVQVAEEMYRQVGPPIQPRFDGTSQPYSRLPTSSKVQARASLGSHSACTPAKSCRKHKQRILPIGLVVVCHSLKRHRVLDEQNVVEPIWSRHEELDGNFRELLVSRAQEPKELLTTIQDLRASLEDLS